MEKNKARAIGTALAELESEALTRVGGIEVTPSLDLVRPILDQLTPQEIYFICLSYFVRMLELASTPDQVEYILRMADEENMCREVTDIGEINQWRGDLSTAGLVAYIGDSAWVPRESTNKTHQALMLTAKNALGRIRTQEERKRSGQ